MDVSVVICAWTERRLEALREAIVSVRDQIPAPAEVIVVVDHNDALLEQVGAEFPEVLAVPNGERRGLSGARNTGIRHSEGDVVAFLDDDASAAPGWLTAMVAALRDERVVGVGGPVRPRWEGGSPGWLPEEFLWVVGCSFRGQPNGGAPVRNPIGANMAFRRSVFERVGGFAHEFARTSGSRLVSCDETEFCIRARREWPGAQIVMVPGMAVEHRVPDERTTWEYFRRRCFGEGFAKALVARSVGSRDGLATERTYVARALPSGAVRGLVEGMKGDRQGIRRAAAILAGLGITTAGYARGVVAARAGR